MIKAWLDYNTVSLPTGDVAPADVGGRAQPCQGRGGPFRGLVQARHRLFITGALGHTNHMDKVCVCVPQLPPPLFQTNTSHRGSILACQGPLDNVRDTPKGAMRRARGPHHGRDLVITNAHAQADTAGPHFDDIEDSGR